MGKTVLIAGGGLAGLSCAKWLLDEGYRVSVYEGLPYLGGRASTFRDADGDWVEQGLHVFLGTYSVFSRLLREVGAPPEKVLFWMTRVRYREAKGPSAVYGVNPLFAPLDTLLGALGQNDYLGPLDKMSLLPIVTPALLPMSELAARFDGMTVTEWWRGAGGTDEIFERFLRPFCRAIQFTDPDDCSAYNFLGWVHHVAYDFPASLLGGYRGARNDSIFRPLAAHLRKRGARVETGRRLVRIEGGRAGVGGFVFEGAGRLEADLYVAAVPAWELGSLLPPSLRSLSFFRRIESLPTAPAISVQLWLDRRVVDHPEFVLTAGTCAPVYQDQSLRTYRARGSRISAIVSPADGYLAWSDRRLTALVRRQLARVEPALAAAKVVKSVVLRHRKHLVRPLPGAMTGRPEQRTPVRNLFLAGDWTQQDYFGSQEGAVRGGRACADAILAGRRGR